MKRGVILTVLIIAVLGVAALGLWFNLGRDNLQAQEEACRGIYTLLREQDFSLAEFEGNGLVLYDKDRNILGQVPLDGAQRKAAAQIIKENGQIRFRLGGMIDDEYGIVFVEGSTVNMDGFYSLERLSGNSFYYKNYP